MQWPSQNVPRGGILQPRKNQYSPETHKFIKLLMEENKLTMTQRRKIDYYLRSGEPLPPPTTTVKSGTKSQSEFNLKATRNAPAITIRANSLRRRNRDTIINSGAYEREKFVPKQLAIDRDKEKNRLINRMAYGKDVQPKIKKAEPKNRQTICVNRFDQLVGEIREREDWLRQMDEIGEAKPHELVIKQQIQARVREMQRLQLNND